MGRHMENAIKMYASCLKVLDLLLVETLLRDAIHTRLALPNLEGFEPLICF